MLEVSCYCGAVITAIKMPNGMYDAYCWKCKESKFSCRATPEEVIEAYKESRGYFLDASTKNKPVCTRGCKRVYQEHYINCSRPFVVYCNHVYIATDKEWLSLKTYAEACNIWKNRE